MPSYLTRVTPPVKAMKLWKWILMFVVGIVAFFILYALSSSFPMLSSNKVVCSVLCVQFAAVMLLLYGAYVKVFEHRKVDEISLSKMLPDTGKGIGFGALYFLLVAGTMFILGCYSIKSYNNNLLFMIFPICHYLMVAVGEEVIFRGVMFRLIAQRWNAWIALLISGLLFGLMHIFNPGATWWSSLAISLEAGIMLGAAYLYTGNLWCPIGIHWAWNFIQGNVLGFAVSGTDSGQSLFTPEIKGSDILTGGAFGAEASIIAVVFGTLLFLFFIMNSSRRKFR